LTCYIAVRIFVAKTKILPNPISIEKRALMVAFPIGIGINFNVLNPPRKNKVRIPTKPAMHSNTKPATHSDLKPASIPI
jgi:hypothetical protein